MKSKISRVGLLLTILFFALGFTSNAQKYYGSACVKLQKSDGKYRYHTVVMGTYTDCYSVTSAKAKLLQLLDESKQYGEEFASNVVYDVEEQNSSNYNGDATARVVNTKGEERTIIVKTSDYSSDKTRNGRKQELLRLLESKKSYDETYYECIIFDLSTN
jgi:hypothetical protein